MRNITIARDAARLSPVQGNATDVPHSYHIAMQRPLAIEDFEVEFDRSFTIVTVDGFSRSAKAKT